MAVNKFDIGGLAAGQVLPPAPFPYVGPGVHVPPADASFPEAGAMAPLEGDEPLHTIFGTPQCVPLKLRCAGVNDGDWYLLPMEPMITIGGGNALVRRYVAKSQLRGSVKERWATDDYSISIEGLLTRNDELRFPDTDFALLRQYMESRQPIEVLCPLLERLHIGRIVIEKYDWPFTKGEENQAYRITAYSDDDWSLFIDPFKNA